MKTIIIFFLHLFSYNCLSQEKFQLFFESNKFELSTTENKSLETWIKLNTTSKIIAIHGFTDEDGGSKFNDSLSQKRVLEVFKKMQNKIKIRADYKSISFGENFKQSPIKSENRKVTIVYLKEKDISRELEIIGLQPKPTSIEEKPIAFPEKIRVTNPDGTKSEYVLDIPFMASLNSGKKGEIIILENLNFVINTYAIVNESRSKLYQLLLVMQQNKKLKINIQGHLCCVLSDKKDLSTQRAKAIYKFLEFNDIDKTRMSYQGFGATKPIFVIPEKTDLERSKNRRVEIEILEN